MVIMLLKHPPACDNVSLHHTSLHCTARQGSNSLPHLDDAPQTFDPQEQPGGSVAVGIVFAQF